MNVFYLFTLYFHVLFSTFVDLTLMSLAKLILFLSGFIMLLSHCWHHLTCKPPAESTSNRAFQLDFRTSEALICQRGPTYIGNFWGPEEHRCSFICTTLQVYFNRWQRFASIQPDPRGLNTTNVNLTPSRQLKMVKQIWLVCSFKWTDTRSTQPFS